MTKETAVFLLNVEKEVADAIKLIDKFRDTNNKVFQIRIFYDYQYKDDYGYYIHDSLSKIANIYVNPTKCNTEPESSRLRRGYIEDYSLISTVIHEFGHFIDAKYNLLKDYKRQKFGKVDIGSYASSSLCEEFAELMVLYFLNPYFVKLISEERHKYLKTLFKSPTPSTFKRFYKLFDSWPEEIKTDCLIRFNLQSKLTELEWESLKKSLKNYT